MRSKKLKARLLIIPGVIIISGLFFSCYRDYVPKPEGYFRIDLPEKSYQPFDTTFPYAFEYSSYASIIRDSGYINEPFWININYPQFSGVVYISYKKVKNNLGTYIEDCHDFVTKHIPKANAIDENIVINRKKKVYGLVFNIKGSDAASPCQFYLTDSTNHFLRGALYFNIAPNNDSLSPVIDFIKEDISHLVSTFNWK